MKIFEQLTVSQKIDALNRTSAIVLDCMASGIVEVELSENTSKALKTVLLKVNSDNPDTIKKFIWKSLFLRKEIYKISRAIVKGTEYNDNGEIFKGTC